MVKGFGVAKMMAMLMVVGALGLPAAAQQASGPIVRCLEGDYYLVQCNAARLQVGEAVSVRRAGHEVATGRVVRSQGQFCSLLIEKGEVHRMDLVYTLTSRPNAQGPELPGAYGSAGRAAAASPTGSASERQSASSSSKDKRGEFFNGLQGGRVLDLSNGQITTDR